MCILTVFCDLRVIFTSPYGERELRVKPRTHVGEFVCLKLLCITESATLITDANHLNYFGCAIHEQTGFSLLKL